MISKVIRGPELTEDELADWVDAPDVILLVDRAGQEWLGNIRTLMRAGFKINPREGKFYRVSVEQMEPHLSENWLESSVVEEPETQPMHYVPAWIREAGTYTEDDHQLGEYLAAREAAQKPKERSKLMKFLFKDRE